MEVAAPSLIRLGFFSFFFFVFLLLAFTVTLKSPQIMHNKSSAIHMPIHRVIHRIIHKIILKPKIIFKKIYKSFQKLKKKFASRHPTTASRPPLPPHESERGEAAQPCAASQPTAAAALAARPLHSHHLRGGHCSQPRRRLPQGRCP